MQAVILKVTEPKRSEKTSGVYQMVFFRNLDTGRSARLCLPHDSSSFKNWDGALDPGNVLDDLVVSEAGVVNVHSHPRLVTKIKLQAQR